MVITLAGAICIPRLPIALFPEITPPTVQVKATYTGAPADVVEATVTTPLEEQINGVQGMIYMASVSANDGSSVIVVSFEVGYDLDIAAVDVQNRAQIAQPQLPSEVQRQGVTVKKQSTDLTLVVNLGSPDDSRDELYLSNYATINIIDVLKRIPGVGDVVNFVGADYSMRIWLDPDRLANLGLAATDVVNAVRAERPSPPARSASPPPRRTSSSSTRSSPSAGSPPSRSSRTSSSARRPTAPSCASGTSAGWTSARRPTIATRA